MKKITLLLLATLLVALSIVSCKSTSIADKTIDVQTQKDTILPITKTIIAKFVRVDMNDIEASIIFERKGGTQIKFYRNVMVPQEPELKYELINTDGNGANASMLGQTFEVTYKVDPQGKLDVNGNPVAANIILALEKK